MVARKATFSGRPQQALVEGEQGLVDGEDVVVPVADEILDDDVEFAAVTQGIARPADQVSVSSRSSSRAMAKARAVALEGR